MPPTTATAQAVDPRALMRIKSLQLRARAVVEGFLKGIHRSPYHGFSVEFSEYRQYSPGDDPRHLDWRLFARSDRYYVKRFEDETNLRCTLVVDTSRSMQFGSLGFTKADYARTTAATIAHFLNLQRDAVGLATFEDRITDYLPPRLRPGQLRRLVGMLERPATGKPTDLDGPLRQVAATVRKRGLVVLLSDLLAPAETLRARLGALRAQGHEVVVFRILDPAEITFAYDAPAMFRDNETGREIYVDPGAARAGYLRRFADHAAAVGQSCSDLGVDFQQVPTDRPLELVLFDLLRTRTTRGRPGGRRPGTGAARPSGGGSPA